MSKLLSNQLLDSHFTWKHNSFPIQICFKIQILHHIYLSQTGPESKQLKFCFHQLQTSIGNNLFSKKGKLSSSITINQSLHAQVGNGKFIDYTDLDGASHVLPYINRSYFYSAPFQVELAAGIPAHSDTSHGKSVLLV